MPVYEYECEDCHKISEVWQSMSDAPLTACPECSGTVKKIISQSSFQLKGGGWYADGYSSPSSEKKKTTPTPPCAKTTGATCNGTCS